MTTHDTPIVDQTAIVIPAYNAASHLRDVIRRCRAIIPNERIIVVDDGSSDASFAIAHEEGVTAIKHQENWGKGKALSTGIHKAQEMGAAYAFTIDADGQHDPKAIPGFLAHLQKTGADIIIGNRMSDVRDMPWLRVRTNRLTSWIISLVAGQKIPDSQSGYRLIKTALFVQIRLETRRYEAESELLIKASKLGAKIEAVPIETIYGEEVSSIHPLIDTLRFFRLVIKSFFW
ncbi:MAG: glycosyltransferase family 2 protein [Candidatus Latescibacterota bacterium]